MIRFRSIFLIIPFLYCLNSASARVLPAEKSRLNYTSVYFEEEWVKDAVHYRLELYQDSLFSNMILKKTNQIPAFWMEDLDWATAYYWRVTAVSAGGQTLQTSDPHSFRIIAITYLNYKEVKVDVKKNDETKHAGGLISIDYAKSIINRKGRQVWAIPPIAGTTLEKMYVRDLRVTADNTITFLTLLEPYEIDLDGNILWKAPHPFTVNSDTINYHHDFKKTARGTYMVLADRFAYRKLIGNPSDAQLKNSPDVKLINDEFYKRTSITYVLEFDKDKKLIWYWDANDYLKDVDLNAKTVQNSTPNFASHANAFCESADGQKVYVSFRDLSRIVKIDKKTKKVEKSFGEIYPSGEANVFVDMKNQHDVHLTGRNSFYTFNNNGFLDKTTVSSILEVKESPRDGEGSTVWKFDLDFDTLSNGKSINGGDVVILPNGNLLFCAGAMNRIFEISDKKEIVWDAFLYSFGQQKGDTWIPFPQYRCNWIKQLSWYYGMAQLSKPLDKKGKRLSGKITVYNTGNIDNRYEVRVVSSKNKVLYSIITPQLKSEESFNLKFKLKTSEPSGNLKFLVKSVNNSHWEVLKN